MGWFPPTPNKYSAQAILEVPYSSDLGREKQVKTYRAKNGVVNTNLFRRQVLVNGLFDLRRQLPGPLEGSVVVLGGLQDGVEGHEVTGRDRVLRHL
jgi:hypothetical protein